MVFAPGLTTWGRVFLSAVIGLGFLVIGESLLTLYRTPIGQEWFLLAALTLISGSASVRLPGAHVSISISEAFVFTAVLLYGPAAGTLTVALDGLVISFWIARRRPEIHRALFNIAAPAVSAWCSAHIFFQVAQIAPLAEQPPTLNQMADLNQILLPLVLFALVYFGLNSWLIAFVVASEKRLSALKVWRSGLVWLSLNYFCGASVAVLLVGYTRAIDLRFIGVVVPLLLVLYFTFKTSMQRVEDANRHVSQLNSLYLSTIETLAMAIDAKDQITHGHIRRVQTYAVGLAEQLGVTDERLIKAIEAAALLHDMGKLAVPEYILNKPGKLTSAEFEKMKLHASVGADILSAIDFPYPVVPIVRHHHENWDGSGYPAGLKGIDIPIGARILSVVDCFDALTSDRPYRPRLSDEEALSVLMERRGSMYDPLIVDKFAGVHSQIAPKHVPHAKARNLTDIAGSAHITVSNSNSPPFDEIAASADEMLTLYELAHALAGQASVKDVGEAIAIHLRRLIPFALSIVFLYDDERDELEAKHAMGDATPLGLRIQLGQRLSGWVAANRQTIANSDPVLDLGEIARRAVPRLRNCLSTALITDDQLVGVLTLYSGEDPFSEDHRRIIETVAKQVAPVFRAATKRDHPTRRDVLTGLPNLTQLEQLLRTTGSESLVIASELTLLFVDIVNFQNLDIKYGQQVRDEIFRHVASQVRAGLRSRDILFRHGTNELVALLNNTDAQTADDVAKRVRETIRSHPFHLGTGGTLRIEPSVVWVSTPQDGGSFRELMAVAHLRIESQPTDSPHVH